jgi:single-stranded-DNA-specific exonuclease
LATSSDEAELLAAEVEQRSLERRSLQASMFEEACELVEREGKSGRAALVVAKAGWNHGIAGIVAGRLAEKFELPAVVIGFDGERGIGSVRGPRGSRLYDALSESRAEVVRFGGHQAAAGVEVRLERLDAFRRAFEQACRQLSTLAVASAATASAEALPGFSNSDPERASVSSAFQFRASDDPVRLLRDLALLEPCGESNEAPSFVFDAELVTAREVKGGHLKLDLRLPSGQGISAFGVELGARAAELGTTVRLLGTLRPDTWRGGGAAEISIQAVLEAGAQLA